jgi:hypothetical protein
VVEEIEGVLVKLLVLLGGRGLGVEVDPRHQHIPAIKLLVLLSILYPVILVVILLENIVFV